MTQRLTAPHSFDNVKAFQDFAATKHEEYYRKAKKYRRLYYATRLIAGLSAGILPFFVWSHFPVVTTGLAIIVVVATVVDSVFSPRDRWALYSKATDLLALAKLKSLGQEQQWKDAWEVIENAELAEFQHLTGLQELLDRARAVSAAGQNRTRED